MLSILTCTPDMSAAYIYIFAHPELELEGGQGALYVCLVCMPYIYGGTYKGTYKDTYIPEAGAGG